MWHQGEGVVGMTGWTHVMCCGQVTCTAQYLFVHVNSVNVCVCVCVGHVCVCVHALIHVCVHACMRL